MRATLAAISCIPLMAASFLMTDPVAPPPPEKVAAGSPHVGVLASLGNRGKRHMPIPVHPRMRPRAHVKHHVRHVTRTPLRITHHAPAPKPKLAPVPTSAVKRFAYDRLGPRQYTCLAHIVSKEDADWDPTKSNYGGSGAYGIPQALPGSKMASAGADWRTNGITQVKWMIGYVDARYGSACQAWSYWQAHHSY